MATAKNIKAAPTPPTTKATPAHPTLNINPNLPNIWVDGLNISAREDSICLLRFFTTLPEGVFEQNRIITHKEKLKNFVDAICENLNYYPIKKIKPKPKK